MTELKCDFFGEYTDFERDLNVYVPPPKKSSDLLKGSALFNEEKAAPPETVLHETKKLLSQYWYNSDPLFTGYVDEKGNSHLFYLSELIKDKIILIDFFDPSNPYSSTCIPRFKELLRRYGGAGLVVIGVCCSQFEFMRVPEAVRAKAFLLGITYPYVVDHDFAIWRVFENQHWPTRILVNQRNEIIYKQVGNEGFLELEAHLQSALREISPGLPCPRLSPEPQETPEMAARVKTKDLYLGTGKGVIGNNTPVPHEGDEVLFDFKDNEIQLSKIYLRGPFIWQKQSISLGSNSYNKGTFKEPAIIKIRFTSTSFTLVAGTKQYLLNGGTPVKLEILVDGKPLKGENRGADVKSEPGKKTALFVVEPRQFEIAKKLPFGEHEIEISVNPIAMDNIEFFAFHFSKK